jgi:hypothetical protein
MNKETSAFDSHLTLVDYTRKIAGRMPVFQYQSVVNDTELDVQLIQNRERIASLVNLTAVFAGHPTVIAGS